MLIPYMKKVLFYLPRFLAILITGFLLFLFLKGFHLNSPTWQDFLMHLLTILVPLIITVLAWKKPNIGGWMFFGIGLFLALQVNLNDLNEAIFSLMPLITGLLFLIEGYFKKQIV